MISNMISSSSIASISQTSRAEVASNSLILTAYDTRDGLTLDSISVLNNDFDDVFDALCTDTCDTLSRDDIPANGGTDFIVLKLENKNIFQVSINNIQVNGVSHTWDSQTGGVLLNANFNDSSGKYPRAGQFSIIPVSNLEQQSIQNIESGDEVRIVIKLSGEIQPDIGLGDSMHILVNLGAGQPAEYLMLAGDTR